MTLTMSLLVMACVLFLIVASVIYAVCMVIHYRRQRHWMIENTPRNPRPYFIK